MRWRPSLPRFALGGALGGDVGVALGGGGLAAFDTEMETSAWSSKSVGSAPEDDCSLTWDGVFIMLAFCGCDKQMLSDIQPGWSLPSLDACAPAPKGCPDPLTQTEWLRERAC